MLGEHKLIVDTCCEVYELVRHWADGEFWDFEHHDFVPGAVYMIGREQFRLNAERIKNLVEHDQALVIFSNPAEGSETIAGQCNMIGINDLAWRKKILILGGGDMDPRYANLRYESFMVKILDYVTNVEAQRRTPEIYSRTDKPYQFLFLNGRSRPQRKYLLERFQLSGLLDQALWTNLDTTSANCRWLTLTQDGEDLLRRPLPVHYLPRDYEVKQFQHNLDTVPDTEFRFLKNHLFSNTWGEIYLRPEPYIDTYFSLVTETVCNYPYSFRTEKIWKPIAMGHPWIAVANTGYYRDLRNMGFRTFDHLIDERFDLIENSQERLDRIHDVVADLCQQDLAEFLASAEEVCKYNQQHLVDAIQTERREFPSRFENFLRQHTNG